MCSSNERRKEEKSTKRIAELKNIKKFGRTSFTRENQFINYFRP